MNTSASPSIDPSRAEAASTLAGSKPTSSLRVLVVEDSEFDARILLNLLRQGGFQLQALRVDRPDLMLTALREKTWDVILCDHSMPGFSAPEALALLQSTGLDIPFLIVSAGIGEDVAVAAMKRGAHDFLIKGNLARLVPAVEREMREAATRAAHRLAENALRESELRHRLVWENSADAVLLLDENGLIRFANPSVKTVFGWDPDSVIQRSIRQLHPNNSEPGWWDRFRGGQRRLMDVSGLRSDGSLVELDIAFSELTLHDRPIIAAFIRDITERKKAEAELRRNREEFELAREIQQRLFPKHPPVFPHCDIAGASFPAEAAGGDYFDYLPWSDGTLGLVIADVSGHGLGPALLMAEARTCLRLLARHEPDTGPLLTAANRALAEDLGDGRYITLGLARINPATKTLTYSSAGHPASLILGSDGQLKAELKRTGPPIGQRREFDYGVATQVTLESGDILVLLTDGIAESLRGEETFGLERVIEVIRENRTHSAADLVRMVTQAARSFSEGQPQTDDLTVLILKWN